MTALPLKADIGALAVTTHGRHTHARNAQPSPVAEFSHAPDFLGTKGRVLPGCCPVVVQHGGFASNQKVLFQNQRFERTGPKLRLSTVRLLIWWTSERNINIRQR